MCKCLEKIQDKFVEKYKDGFKGKKIRSAIFANGYNFETGESDYFIPLIVEAVGQKKQIEVPVLIKHCPICGEQMHLI